MDHDAKPTCQAPVPDRELVCDECGAAGAFSFGDVKLCMDCYVAKGSCCPEFGKDDLWRGNPSLSR